MSENAVMESTRKALRERTDQLYFALRDGEQPLTDEAFQELKTNLQKLMYLHLQELKSEVEQLHARIELLSGDTEQDAGEAKTTTSDPEAKVFVGRLERRAWGGVIVTDCGQRIYVPEARFASMGLEHGMIMQARQIGTLPDGKPRYYFSILDASAAHPNPDRKEVFGVAEYYDSTFSVVKAGGVEILVDNRSMAAAGAVVGDVVKVAYLESEVEDGTVRGAVIRRLTENELEPPPSLSGQLPSQSRSKNEDEERSDEEPSIRFQGSPKILVVGGRNWRWWREGLIRYGADEPEWIEGFRDYPLLEDSLSRFDIVIAITTYVSHSMYEKAKTYCKQKGKLFVQTTQENWSGFCKQVLEPELIPKWNQLQASEAP